MKLAITSGLSKKWSRKFWLTNRNQSWIWTFSGSKFLDIDLHLYWLMEEKEVNDLNFGNEKARKI